MAIEIVDLPMKNGDFSMVLLVYQWLVVSTPLKNMSSSVGIIIPN